MLDRCIKWEVMGRLKLLREIGANIDRRQASIESVIGAIDIAGYGGLAHSAQAAPLGIKREDAQRLASATLVGRREAMPNADSSVCLKDEEGVRIVAARVYKILDIVFARTVILEVTA